MTSRRNSSPATGLTNDSGLPEGAGDCITNLDSIAEPTFANAEKLPVSPQSGKPNMDAGPLRRTEERKSGP